MTHTPQPLLPGEGGGRETETIDADIPVAIAFIRVNLHTVNTVSLDESAASLSHYNTIRVAVTDVVAPQDWIPSSTDVHSAPLILSDHIL